MSKDPTLASAIYDVSPKQREIIEWRAKKRLELRTQYLKEVHSPKPNWQGYLFDPQLQRQYSAKARRSLFFKPSFARFLTWHLMFVTAWVSTFKMVKKDRVAKETERRQGKVSYYDRDWKFV